MMKTKKIVALALIAVLSLGVMTLTSCGNGDDDTLLAVTEPTFPPFDTTDDDGNLVGFDMDLLNAIAEDQGFKVEYKALEFDALIPAIESEQADIIAAGMNAEDPERQKKVNFSNTYYDSGLVVVVKADNTTVNSVDDLTSDMKVAGQIGTTSADKVNELADAGQIAEAVVLNKNSDAILQLTNGDVSAIIMDLPVATSYIKQHPDEIKIVGETMNAEAYGFAVNKDNDELLKKINAGLQNVIDSGKYDELVDKWFN
jgi:ABC-type amino acid transport substrate-binding protein